ENIININFILGVLLKRWYLFLLSVIISFSVGYLYIKYSVPIYSVSTNVFVKDKSTHSYGTQFLEGLEMFQSFRNLENEMIFLRSTTIVNKAIDRLDFDISYFHQGQLVDSEIYGVHPFEIVVDTTTAQLVGLPIYINFIDDSTFNLVANGVSVALYDIKKQMVSSYRIPILKVSNTCKVGQTINIENTKFKIETKGVNTSNLKSNTYYFIIWDRNNLVRSYRSRIVVKPVKNESSILEISSQGPVVQKEINFVNALANAYIQEGLQEKNQIATNTINFIDAQLGIIKDSLSLAEDELEDFRTTNKVVDIGASYTGDLENLRMLETERAMIQIKRKYYDYLLGYVNSNKDIKQITIPSAIGIDDPLLTNLILELTKLSQEKAALSFSVHEKNPYSNILDLKIENAKEALREDIKNIVHGEQIKYDEITSQINKISKKIDALPKTEKLLINLKRKFDLSDHIYNYLLEKRAEASIAKASNISDSKVIDYATSYDVTKIFPLTNKIYFISVMIGLLIPFMGILIMVFLDNRLKDKDQLLQLTQIPILGIIGHNHYNEGLVTISHPKSGITESFRSTRVNLSYITLEKNKVIGITSTVSGEGKSFCALNLSSILASSDKKVLLIGADLRKPKIFKEFHMENDKGLSSYLINQCSFDEVVHKTEVSNLDVIVSGPIPPNPSELLSSSLFGELINIARKKYDYIIIDTPPVGIVSDYLVINKHIDVNIYVVRFNYSKTHYVNTINELYNGSKISSLCILANDAKASNKGYGYTYSYGYGYYEDVDHTWLERIKKKIKRA
ncbi:MAG: GumC family protein, partial [Cytophaga sp.]|uniref:GumC family protein n=1 Tax=Cytophaga sp. TaxID=29535 RepID=UPI003F7F0A73